MLPLKVCLCLSRFLVAYVHRSCVLLLACVRIVRVFRLRCIQNLLACEFFTGAQQRARRRHPLYEQESMSVS